MAKRNRVRVVSRFNVAADAGRDAVKDAIAKAIDDGHAQAERRLALGATKRGYDLPRDVGKEAHAEEGRIWYDHWYGRFFEYGTVTIPALSFIRPGYRKARKTLKDTLADDFEGYISKRAKVRRR